MDIQQLRDFIALYKPISDRSYVTNNAMRIKLAKIERLLNDPYTAPESQEELNTRVTRFIQEFSELRLAIVESSAPFASDPFEGRMTQSGQIISN